MGVLEKNKKIITIICFLGVFICVFCFYYYAHPLIIFDGDDWYGVSSMRAGAIPNPLSFNPVKVLPETLFPLMGRIAVTFIYPWKGDYLRSISLALGILMGVIITIYTLSFYDFLRRKIKIGELSALALSILFLLFHFLIFRKDRMFNEYMFATHDANCYFNYIIPFLANASMMLFFCSRDIEEIFSKDNSYKRVVKNSILVVALYLCLFSNIIQSGLLACFFITRAIVNAKQMDLKVKDNIYGYIVQNKIKLLYILIWLFSLFLESHGERAGLTANGESLISKLTITRIGTSIYKLFRWAFRFNRLFIPIAVGSIVVCFILLKRDMKKDLFVKKVADCLLMISFLGGMYICYLVMLVSVVKSFDRIDVSNGAYFFLLVIIIICIACIIEKLPWVKLFIPLLLYVVLCETMFGISVYRETTFEMPPEFGYSVGNYIIESVVNADKEGKDEIEIKIPEKYGFGDSGENDYLALALYRHGIVSHKIRVFLIVDKSLNEKFGIVDN